MLDAVFNSIQFGNSYDAMIEKVNGTHIETTVTYVRDVSCILCILALIRPVRTLVYTYKQKGRC